MSQPGEAAPEAAGGADLIKETTTSGFRKDVIAESARTPVLVDFWAPWCGPCRQLTPLLEKAVRTAGGKIRLVKMNIDEHPQIAGQLGIQSIPAVIAFQGGQPVDGFMGALPESQIKAFIERLIGPTVDSEAVLLEQAASARAEGDDLRALQIYEDVLSRTPGEAKALAGLISIYSARGDLAQARELVESLPAESLRAPAVSAALTALELAEQAVSVGDVADLERRVAANPDDHQSRFDLALALNARGDKTRAADALLESFRRDAHWNEDAARKQLLQFFEAWGPTDPETIAARRRLSSILFS